MCGINGLDTGGPVRYNISMTNEQRLKEIERLRAEARSDRSWASIQSIAGPAYRMMAEEKESLADDLERILQEKK